MKPTYETETFYDDARRWSENAQYCLSLGLYRLAAQSADWSQDAWLKVKWEKQDESC